jgi:hypothetical protein
MLRLQHLLTSCTLAFCVSVGLSLLCPSHSSATTLDYIFTFTQNPGNAPTFVSGSFSVPVADFAGNPSFLPNTDITGMSLVEGSTQFTLSDVLTGPTFLGSDGLNYSYSGNVPTPYYYTAGWLVSTPQGCDPNSSTCSAGIQIGNTGLLDVIVNGGLTQVGGIWTTTETPLPSTWTMLIAGFAGLGFFAYRGSKKNTAALSAA